MFYTSFSIIQAAQRFYYNRKNRVITHHACNFTNYIHCKFAQIIKQNEKKNLLKHENLYES